MLPRTMDLRIEFKNLVKPFGTVTNNSDGYWEDCLCLAYWGLGLAFNGSIGCVYTSTTVMIVMNALKIVILSLDTSTL